MIPARPAEAGRGVDLRIAGFPTRIRPTFLVLIALVGWYPGVTPERIAIWVIVASAAVMWHELGHAMAARRLGAAPTIELYGFGGLTSWQPPRDPSRRQLIGVTFAGPLAGLVVGALTAVGVAVAGGVGSGDVRYLVLVVLWTNVGWSLFNLIPVLPLDGGHIMAELLPGDRATRQLRAAAVSVVVAGIALVALLAAEVVFGALILGWVMLTNLSALRVGRAARKRAAVEARARDALGRFARGEPAAIDDIDRSLVELRPHSAPLRAVAIETAAATGDAAAARHLLDRSPDDEQLAPGLYALVFAAESDGRDGVPELAEIFRREPSAPHGRWLAIALRWANRLDDLAPILASVGDAADPAVFGEAAAVAEGFGNRTVALDVRALRRA